MSAYVKYSIYLAKLPIIFQKEFSVSTLYILLKPTIDTCVRSVLVQLADQKIITNYTHKPILNIMTCAGMLLAL